MNAKEQKLLDISVELRMLMRKYPCLIYLLTKIVQPPVTNVELFKFTNTQKLDLFDKDRAQDILNVATDIAVSKFNHA